MNPVQRVLHKISWRMISKFWWYTMDASNPIDRSYLTNSHISSEKYGSASKPREITVSIMWGSWFQASKQFSASTFRLAMPVSCETAASLTLSKPCRFRR